MSELDTLEKTLMAEIASAGDEAAIEAVRVSALGKKGSISERLKTLGAMSPEERQTAGPAINGLKNRVTEALTARGAAAGASRVALQVEVANKGAVALYRKLGYAEHHRYTYCAG